MKKRRFLMVFGICALSFSSLVSCGGDNPTPPDDNNPNNPGENPGEEPGKDDDEIIEISTGPALPEGEKGLAVHYNREDENYADWCLWLWENNGGEGQIPLPLPGQNHLRLRCDYHCSGKPVVPGY